jgi:hypothetical protein
MNKISIIENHIDRMIIDMPYTRSFFKFQMKVYFISILTEVKPVDIMKHYGKHRTTFYHCIKTIENEFEVNKYFRKRIRNLKYSIKKKL